MESSIIGIANMTSLVIAVFICVISIVIIQKYNKRKITIMLLPLTNFGYASVIQMNYILWYGRLSRQESLSETFRLYFSNDASMMYIFCYIPSIVVGTVIPLLVIAIFALREKTK